MMLGAMMRREAIILAIVITPTSGAITAPQVGEHLSGVSIKSQRSELGATHGRRLGEERRMLRFETCGGFTNQRIALVTGILIGRTVGRTVVMPSQLNANGVQRPAGGYRENRETLVNFSRFYDHEATTAALAELGIDVASTTSEVDEDGSSLTVDVMQKLHGSAWYLEQLWSSARVVRLSCTFLAMLITPGQVLDDYWLIDQALVPAEQIRSSADLVLASLQQRSVERGASGEFNALHLRNEPDWSDHCKLWESHEGDAPRDNCKTNTEQLDKVFATEDVATMPPLYIAGQLQASELEQVPELAVLMKGSQYVLPSAMYNLIVKAMIMDLGAGHEKERDLLAAVDYAVAAKAHTFVGNSVSTFSAHLLMGRRHAQQARLYDAGGISLADFHYNGGNVPLVDVMYAKPEPAVKANKLRAAGSAEEELQCYFKRYPDLAFLNGEPARILDHWTAFGKKEGRKMGCDHVPSHGVPTDEELKCYFKQNKDLAFLNGEPARILDHWKAFGRKEGRRMECTPTLSEMCTVGSLNCNSLAKTPRSLKWVFTVSGRNTPAYDEMAKVAVRSAFRRTSLIPVCVFYGTPDAPLAQWLASEGVRMIFHTAPVWRQRLVDGVKSAQAANLGATASVLFQSVEMEMATFLRIDVSILGFVDEFILYADVDILFLCEVSVADFGKVPPRVFTIGSELYPGGISVQDSSLGPNNALQLAGNAGMMLLNVEGMRRTHARFVEWTFSAEHIEAGLQFGVYGPADQGALNSFYRGKFEVKPWPLFNWKPHWGLCRAAKVVHFHGPKPGDYLRPNAADQN
jgi:hypothetical protein